MAERRDLIDRERYREHYQRLQERARNPVASKNVVRARVRLVENQLKEGQLGNHVVYADEPLERGGTDKGPAPLEYLVASVGF